MESPFANVRAGAAEELACLVAAPTPACCRAARIALEKLADDDSKRVSEAAARALARSARRFSVCAGAARAASRRGRARRIKPAGRAAAAAPRAQLVDDVTARCALARAAQRQDAARARRRRAARPRLLPGGELGHGVVLRAGLRGTLVCLVAARGFWRGASGRLAVLASRRGRLAARLRTACCSAVGVIACAAMAAFVASIFEFAGTAVVTTAGAAAIAAAGALGRAHAACT